MTKLGSTLPKDDGNGLVAISGDLIHDPHKVHIVIAMVDCSKLSTDTDTGLVIPTARIRSIEVALDGDDADTAEAILRRALQQRTGRDELPFDDEPEDRHGLVSMRIVPPASAQDDDNFDQDDDR